MDTEFVVDNAADSDYKTQFWWSVQLGVWHAGCFQTGEESGGGAVELCREVKEEAGQDKEVRFGLYFMSAISICIKCMATSVQMFDLNEILRRVFVIVFSCLRSADD